MLEADGTIYKLSADLVLRKIERPEKYWAFNVTEGEHYSLNKTSYWILSHFDGRSKAGDVYADFLDVYEVDEKEAQLDFQEIVENFIHEGLLEEGARHENQGKESL